MVEKWDPVLRPQEPRDPQDSFQPPEPPETPRTSWDPENLPGITGISRNVTRKKYFSGIIVNFLYLRNYNISSIKISQF